MHAARGVPRQAEGHRPHEVPLRDARAPDGSDPRHVATRGSQAQVGPSAIFPADPGRPETAPPSGSNTLRKETGRPRPRSTDEGQPARKTSSTLADDPPGPNLRRARVLDQA